MKLIPTDPNVISLLHKIRAGRLQLQPDFQRQEVWSTQKKKKLVDTILRNWHIPPIHAVANPETKRLEVLDGQQRLAAIRDFAEDLFPIDGRVSPKDPVIEQLNGLYYSQLPRPIRDDFDDFPIRLLEVHDYMPEEAYELFYRLNQPTSLTAPEQRNAFMGLPRQQIRDLVEYLDELGLGAEYFGFTNVRLAYDDVLSKAVYALDLETLRKKISGRVIADRYRSNEPFKRSSIELVRQSLKMLAYGSTLHVQVKYNKASLFSALVFLSVATKALNSLQSSQVDATRRLIIESIVDLLGAHNSSYSRGSVLDGGESEMRALYRNRSSSRVADVKSVLVRDVIHWYFLYKTQSCYGEVLLRHPVPGHHATLKKLMSGFQKARVSSTIEEAVESTVWGAEL